MGKSETLLGEALRAHRGALAYVATKIPPKNMKWPGKAEYPVADTLSAGAHPRIYREEPRRTSGSGTIDLQQFHVWSDAVAADDSWQRAVDDLKAGRARARRRHQREPVGGRPTCSRALKTGLIDSVQVVYNIFDQAPRRRAVALLPGARHRGHRAGARSTRGSLTGTLTPDSKWPEGDLAQPLLQPRAPRRDAGARWTG